MLKPLESSVLSKGRIILVEDDAPLRKVLREQLATFGFDVAATANAGEFLGTLVGGSAFDVAIVDLCLPGLNGATATSWIAESEDAQFRDLPIIILTGRPDIVGAVFEKLPNVWRVLFKPCSIDRLLSVIDDCLDNQTRH